MEVNAPSKLPIHWFPVNQIGIQTWGKLKARLTGKKNEFAGKYFSFVNLSESDADKLIENIKKSGKLAVLEDESGDNLEIYQNWLVDTYLESSSPDIGVGIDENINVDENEEVKGESIREDENRERALALYEGTREDDLVSEEVDERILKLLGLDEVFTIDYGIYMTLLRGKMAEARMVDKKLSTDEVMLLTDEFKRVKEKVGRFKLKKKKITADNFGVTGPIQVSKQQYYLTSKAIIPEISSSDEGGDFGKKLSNIGDVVEKILDSLRGQNKLIKKSEENERKKREDQRRKGREEFLEKGLSKVASLASKMLAPVQGIIDKILNFILYTLLGRAFVAFIDWFNNPKNKEKVEVLKRFLKDWWPTLLGALILFTTPFGKFVRTFVGTVTKLTLRLAKFAIPKLLKFVKSNPKTAALVAAGTAAVGAGIYMQSQREQRDKELQQVDPNYGKKPGPMKSIIDFGTMGGMQFTGGGMVPLPKAYTNGGISPLPKAYAGGGMIPVTKAFTGGGEQSSLTPYDGGMIPVAKAFTGGGEQSSLTPYDGDGYVDDSTGIKVTGAGADTQATILQPGEVVFSKKAVNYWGADRLLAMNKMGGGTNTPKFVNNLQMASGGGMIGERALVKVNPFLGLLRSGVQGMLGAFSNRQNPSKMGPEQTSGMIQNAYRRQPNDLVRSAKSMIADKWSYASRGGDAKNGCAPAIVELYRRSGYPLPWKNIKNPNYVPDVYNYLSKNFVRVSEDKRSAGDIVVWRDTGYPPGSNQDPYGHIGMVMSDGRIANNSSSKGTFTNLNSPSEAKSWWPNTKELLYFRHPKINESLLQKSSKKSQKVSSTSLSSPSLLSQLSNNKPNVSSSSSPSLLSQLSNNKPNVSLPGPPVANAKSSFIELPPIVQQATQRIATSSGTKIPPFMSPDFTGAKNNAKIYGIG